MFNKKKNIAIIIHCILFDFTTDSFDVSGPCHKEMKYAW